MCLLPLCRVDESGLDYVSRYVDHKGPLVYLIYLGCTRVVGLYGVWLLDFVVAYLLLLVFYRIARLFTEAKDALIISGLMSLYLNLPFTDEGGPEWLAAIGCAYTCYIFAKHLKDNDYFKFHEILLLSMAVAVCLMTKANTSAGIIPVAGYVVCHLVCHFDVRVFLRYAGAVLLGLGVMCAPVFLWMNYQGNMADFIHCYWVFNTQEYGSQPDRELWICMRDITLVCLPGFLLYGYYACFHRRDWKIFFWYSLLFIMSVALNAYAKNGYPHYTFPCYGVFTLLLAASWNELFARKRWYIFTLTLFLVVGTVTWGVRGYMRLMPFDRSHDYETAGYINSADSYYEYVMVYGIDDRSQWDFKDPAYSFPYRLWLLLDGKPASKYFYFPPGVPSELREDAWLQIQANAPMWIVAHSQNSGDIIQLGYSVCSTDAAGYQILKKQ